jgi:hypothetical protein
MPKTEQAIIKIHKSYKATLSPFRKMIGPNSFWKKWHIFIKIIPLLIIHRLGYEIISLNALFTSIIAATTFLIGFLITGVISDYKESEKIPGEMAISLEALHDEASIIYTNKKADVAKEFLSYHKSFMESLIRWFYKKERTKAILGQVSRMNDYLARFEPLAQATFINRMKQEQGNIRKQIGRIHAIRETNFVQTAYAILESITFFLILGLVFLKLEPFYEAMFFVLIVSFTVLYMIHLIKDLDNPFDYKEFGETGSEISLKPIRDLMERLHENQHD